MTAFKNTTYGMFNPHVQFPHVQFVNAFANIPAVHKRAAGNR